MICLTIFYGVVLHRRACSKHHERGGWGGYREFVQMLSPLTDNPNTLDSFGRTPS